MLQITKERECPKCGKQITDLRIERKVEQYFEMTVDDPSFDDYDPAIFNEDDWKAICYTVEDGAYGNGCMYEFENFSPDDNAQWFMEGEVDGYGEELTNVKAKIV